MFNVSVETLLEIYIASLVLFVVVGSCVIALRLWREWKSRG